MEILTTRFGPVTINAQDRVEFPKGLVGVAQLKRFALVADPQVRGLTWLQSTRDPVWALALVSPRVFVPDFAIRTTPDQLRPIQLESAGDADVYVTLNRTVQNFTVNLQAPIIIHRRRSLGMQLVLSDSQFSVRHTINFGAPLRMSA